MKLISFEKLRTRVAEIKISGNKNVAAQAYINFKLYCGTWMNFFTMDKACSIEWSDYF